MHCPACSELTVLVVHKDSPNDQMVVFFPDDELKVDMKTIEYYWKKMEDGNISRAIIVGKNGMTPSAKQVSHVSCILDTSSYALMHIPT